MLTRDEQDEIVRMALGLVRQRLYYLNMLKARRSYKARVNALWAERLDEFRDFLKELGDVPMPNVPVASSDVAESEEAHTSNGTQTV